MTREPAIGSVVCLGRGGYEAVGLVVRVYQPTHWAPLGAVLVAAIRVPSDGSFDGTERKVEYTTAQPLIVARVTDRYGWWWPEEPREVPQQLSLNTYDVLRRRAFGAGAFLDAST